MAAFPDISTVPIRATVGYSIQYKTLTSRFESGDENRKQKWLFPRRTIRLQMENITKAQGETLWQFYIARAGAYEAFNFFLPEPNADYPSYIKEYVGTGDGSTEVFNLPSKSASAYTLYQDDVALIEGTDYNFTAQGGADGADKIDFSDSGMVEPGSGARLTFSFTGILKVRCVFAEDNLSYEQFMDRLFTGTLELRGLLNE